jgi:TonB family protein
MMNRGLIISAAAHLAMLLLLWQVSVSLSRPVTRGYPRLMTATLVAKSVMAPAASAGSPPAAEPKVVSPPAPQFTPVEKKEEPAKVTSKPDPKKALSTSKPPATKSPAAPASSSGSSGNRGSATTPQTGAGSGGNSIRIDAAAFPYGYYSEAIQNRIESNWQAPPGPERLIAIVYFKIMRRGEIEDIKLERPSGSFEFDRAAISAVTYASPLPPLPDDYREQTLVVRYEFAANN